MFAARQRDNVTAKDFILKLLSLEYIRSGKALAKVIEYSGEAIEALGVDERATMTNMAAEIGGFTGIVAPDQKVVEFLVERRGMSRNEGGDADRRVCTAIPMHITRMSSNSTQPRSIPWSRRPAIRATASSCAS